MKNILLLLCAVWLCGCAGGRCKVTAHSVLPPVSCTPCVWDAAGRVRTAKPQEIVQHIELSKSSWSMLWKTIPLGNTEWDLSPELNAKLQETSGNAIINVTVHAKGCTLLHWYLAALVPIIPSYEHVNVQGDVVRMTDTAP